MFLFLAAEIVDRADAQGVARRNGGRLGAVHPGDLLHGDDIGNIVHGLAIVCFSDKHAEQADLAHFAREVGGKFLGFIQFQGHRRNLALGELADLLANHFLFSGQVKIHDDLLSATAGAALPHRMNAAPATFRYR